MNHEFIGKTINGEPKGVPADIFDKDRFEGKIYTASGCRLNCYVSPELIALSDPSNWYYNHPCGMRAVVVDRILALGIYTKGFGGDPQQRHPDLFAGDLLEAAFNFFKRQNTQIDSVKCQWEADLVSGLISDTYQQFLDALNLYYNPEPSLDQQLRAAKQVWTARKIAFFGYTKIIPDSFIWNEQLDNSIVICLFTKP